MDPEIMARMDALEKLMTSAVRVRGNEYFLLHTGRLAVDRKVASLVTWTLAVYAAAKAEWRLRNEEDLTEDEQVRHRECYVGKERIKIDEV